MFYRLLGMLVWNGAKVILRQKYGRTYLPKPVRPGAVIAAVGVASVAARRNGSDS